jgi:hypothetical protein
MIGLYPPIQLRLALASPVESDSASPASTIPQFPPLTRRTSPVAHTDGGSDPQKPLHASGRLRSQRQLGAPNSSTLTDQHGRQDLPCHRSGWPSRNRLSLPMRLPNRRSSLADPAAGRPEPATRCWGKCLPDHQIDVLAGPVPKHKM